jgi:hypothetical protein
LFRLRKEVDNLALVKNIHGSADNTPPAGCSSWKEYWEKAKNKKFSSCSCTSCFQRAVVGGHVKKVYGSNEWYIVPLCASCNSYTNTNPFEVCDADLVRVVK